MKFLVKVKRAKNRSVIQISDTEYEVSVKAKPINGKANDEMIELLAQYFNVPKSQIDILTGQMSPKKIIQIL